MSRVDDSPLLRNVSRHATPALALVALAAVLCLPGCTVRDILVAEVQPASPNLRDRIAFTSLRDGNWEIYVMGSDGSSPIRLTNHPAHDWGGDWSPDGKAILFSSHRDGNREIYVMGSDGERPARLTNHPAYDEMPAWSPEGERIAFSSDRAGNFDIYVMDASGRGVARLTDSSRDEWVNDWSPLGNGIIFSKH